MGKAFAGHLHAFGALMVRGDLRPPSSIRGPGGLAQALRPPLQL